MTVSYSVYDPTGNITALVTTHVPVPEQPRVAASIMAREPETEQVGFVTAASGTLPALRMAGGEFCGNASMCAAALLSEDAACEDTAVTLTVSGAEDPVTVRLSAAADGVRTAAVTMPRPLRITDIELPGTGRAPVVFFPGIAHVILPFTADRSAPASAAAQWASLLKADAVGLLFFDREASLMEPLVCVPTAGTLVWERSCASGTTAVGAYLADTENTSVSLPIRQPGGILTVDAAPGGPPVLTGRVRRRGGGCL